MALLTIPVVLSSPDVSLQVTLDNVVYGFRFLLNERTNRFSMEIQDQNGNAIVSGIAVVTNWSLLERFKDPALPQGRVFTCDMTGGELEPDETSFGDTILLCYDEALAA